MGFKLGTGTPRLFRKQCLLACWQRFSRCTSKGWAQRTKGSHLIYPCKQVKEAKSKVSPIYGCMQLYWLLYPQCYVTFFTFELFKFYLSAMPSPSPIILSEHRLACFFSFFFLPSSLLHYSPLWCSDPSKVKEHHLDLGVCTSIESLHVWPFFFCGIHNGPDRQQYQGTRQGNIKRAPKIRPITSPPFLLQM
jgi:hypothetical protein